MYQNGSEWTLHYVEWRLLSVGRIQMRKSSSAAPPAFIKPLINELAGTGFHIDPHAAIPDIQHGVEERDRKHYSDKCYLISGTVVQVCHVIYEQSGWFSLILMVFLMSGILLAGSTKPTFCRVSTYSAVHSTDQSCGQRVSVCLHLETKRNLLPELHSVPQFDHWPKCTPPQLRPPAWAISWALLLSSDGRGLPQLRCLLAALRWTRGSQRGRELTTAFPWLAESLSRSHRLRVTCCCRDLSRWDATIGQTLCISVF